MSDRLVSQLDSWAFEQDKRGILRIMVNFALLSHPHPNLLPSQGKMGGRNRGTDKSSPLTGEDLGGGERRILNSYF